LFLLGVLATVVTVVARRRSAPRTAPTGADPSGARWPPFDPPPSDSAEAD
jgi:hypothetical protein